ncbi:hypothetical protein [Paenibacillus alginolyticus]|nr:hypothetical protein [Paenibacillus alginolyticus]
MSRMKIIEKDKLLPDQIMLPLNHNAQKLTELPVQGLTNIMTVSQ